MVIHQDVTIQPQELAQEARLRYITDTLPGFSRLKKGDVFTYYDEKGNRITDEKVLERIKKLVIPPAWTDVWISPFPNGHIQATGKDEKGRKQYRYHERWMEIAKEQKFDKLLFFSTVLPEIRKKMDSDMQSVGLSKEKVLATIVWILQHTYIRIGNEEYAKKNNHFGLTTLRNKHVDFQGSTVKLEFVGKSGIEHEVDITNPKIVKIMKKLDELPGYELFQYIDNSKERHIINSEEVNEYLKSITGDSITAKDFRTWGGTVLFADTLVDIGPFTTKKEMKKNMITGVKEVAHQLGNTPTVCRTYYIHPVIGESYEKEVLIPHFESIDKRLDKKPAHLGKSEFAVKTLLEAYTTK